ncbi:outer envelope pore protein 21 [Cucumis melo var. makuwa]|uniref:Outer envelope pore protein 21 n=1 Tax=Cucumis melo var. makuwa TaxID=1194695 RepID=A0A5A7TA37_CUCMM|nr:outer envelope pore protein 21 [Cucumis melo var. makuwa]
MDTSFRYAGDSRALRIHAKEKISLDSNIFLQVRGELDTRIGEPSLLAASVRQFNQDVRFSWQPIQFLQVFVFLFIIVNQMQLSASAGLGVQYDKYKKLHYVGRGKMSFPVTTDGLLRFTIKGQSHLDKDFKQIKYKGAAEFSLGVLNFQREQDVRVKVGYEVFEKVE